MIKNPLRVKILLILALIGLCVIINGCSKASETSSTAAIEGMAYLSQEDKVAKNAGILIYLAGTSHQARTDLNGKYIITGVPTGKYDLIAEKEGFQTQVISDLEVTGSHSSSNPLKPKAPILEKAGSGLASSTSATQNQMGVVTGAVYLENAPLSGHGGVRIEIDGTPIVAVSSTEGRYQFPELVPGVYRFYFQKDGYEPFLSNEMTITSGTNVIADVALLLNNPVAPPADPSIEGTLNASRTSGTPEMDLGEEDLPAATPRSIFGRITLVDTQDQVLTDFSDVMVSLNDNSMFAEVDDTGNYRFDNLTSGIYVLVAAKPNAEVFQTELDITRRRNTRVDARLVVGRPIEGGSGGVAGQVLLLSPNDEPLQDSSGVTVSVLGTQYSATTDINGTFAIDSVPTGTYTLNLSKQGFKTASLEGLSVTDGQIHDIGTLRLAPDLHHPYVIATSPELGAQGVKVEHDLVVLIQFNTKMNADSVKRAITIVPEARFEAFIGNGSHANATDDTAAIVISNRDHNMPIRFSQNYAIRVSTAAQDMNGVGLAEDFSLRFKTDAPGIVSTYPADGAVDVQVDDRRPLRIAFNVALDPRSIQERFIRVRPDAGVNLNLTPTADGSTGWTLLTVGGQWQPNTNYTVTINRGMRSKGGQYLGNTPYTFRFKTKAIEINAPDTYIEQ